MLQHTAEPVLPTVIQTPSTCGLHRLYKMTETLRGALVQAFRVTYSKLVKRPDTAC